MKRLSRTTNSLAFGVLLGMGAAGCNQSEFEDIRGEMVDSDGDDDGGDEGPGGNAREDSNVSCETIEDCGPGEACIDAVCQMERCADGPYSSQLPLSPNLRFLIDRELVVADGEAAEGSFFVDGYAPESGSIEYPGSWDMGSTQVVDVVGGDFFGQNPELFVVATAGNTRIRVGGVEEEIEIDVGFQPHALAAGDTDGDDKDEVFVLGQFGNYAMCGLDDLECVTGFFQNGEGVDVAIGDVDGDTQNEVVFLLENQGSLLYVFEVEGEGEDYQGPAVHELTAIEVGDPDGDGLDEIFGLQAGGTFSGAQLHAYSGMGGGIALLNSQTVDDTSMDLTFGDLDTDEQDELIILREGAEIELFDGAEGSSQLSPVLTHFLTDSNAPTRIASVDFDGDSPRTYLMNAEPILVPGQVVPVALGLFPPFEREFSDGASSIAIGRSESTSESFTDSVSLDMGIDMGVSVGFFDIAKAGIGTRVSRSLNVSETQIFTQSIGTRFSAQPEQDFEGEPYGVVTMTCGCFHAYQYRIEDPAGKLADGADSEQFVLTVPVGGSEIVWSTRRYNAMAEKVGNLPIMEVPYQIGNVESYPEAPERLDGSPIPEDDLVFIDPPTILVSDAGSSSFRLAVGELQINTVTMSTSIGMRLDASAEIPFLGGGVKFGADLGVGWGKGYGVRVGENAFFGGSLPAILDNPSTPEDEYIQNAYTTLPYVYREHYTDADGNDAAYYVVSYAVAEN